MYVIGRFPGLTGLVLWAISSVAMAAGPAVETFDNDAAGWTGNTTSATVVHVASGGNPDGHIQSRKDLSPPVFDIGALIDAAVNPHFGGNYAAAGIGQVSVDLNFLIGDFGDAWVRFRPSPVQNGWRFPLTNAFPLDQWNTYSVNFDPTWTDQQAHDAGWLTDKDVDPAATPSPSFANVFAAVDTAEVRIASTGSTLVGIDNFRIAVPEPATSLLCLISVLGAVVRRRFRD